ncbi:MAG: LysR family transcriptional regulator [Pelagibacterium sp. SCN 64-44]|nr:MAG: LysR family transcriptional regulator [Pelagibacterium sp. SCN 64-44]
MDDHRTPDWNQMRALLATAEAGSLSGAARKLGLTQPTLGRQVAALERSLGVTLFERAGRGLILTQVGQDLVAQLTAMGEAAARVRHIASRQSEALEGMVRITTSDAYAAYVLPPILENIRKSAPGIVIDVLASNAVEDLIRRRADIAIRHVQPVEAELIARRCPDAQARLYGARQYLDRIGRARRAQDLRKADFIGFSEHSGNIIAELNGRGVPVEAKNFPLTTGSGLIAWEWVRQGRGLAMMMDAVARVTPDVEDAWPALEGVPVPVWLATHRELRTARRIRFVFDAMVELLAR